MDQKVGLGVYPRYLEPNISRNQNRLGQLLLGSNSTKSDVDYTTNAVD